MNCYCFDVVEDLVDVQFATPSAPRAWRSNVTRSDFKLTRTLDNV